MLDGLTLDKVKMAALIITIITTLAGWYQAWVKGGEVTATQKQVTAVATTYSTHYHYGECDK